MQQSKTGIFYLTISKQNLFHIANYFVEMNISLRITFELQDKKPVKKGNRNESWKVLADVVEGCNHLTSHKKF